jgi:hypothetical protein
LFLGVTSNTGDSHQLKEKSKKKIHFNLQKQFPGAEEPIDDDESRSSSTRSKEAS